MYCFYHSYLKCYINSNEKFSICYNSKRAVQMRDIHNMKSNIFDKRCKHTVKSNK